MDYLMDGIIIVFVLCCIFFIFIAGTSQHGSKNFPTPKDDPQKKENDEWSIKEVLSVTLNKGYLKNGNGQRKWKTERRSKASKTRKPEIAENS